MPSESLPIEVLRAFLGAIVLVAHRNAMDTVKTIAKRSYGGGRHIYTALEVVYDQLSLVQGGGCGKGVKNGGYKRPSIGAKAKRLSKTEGCTLKKQRPFSLDEDSML